MIERYLREVVWQADGMDYPRVNCWGLARHVRHELYGLPMLPAFSIDAANKVRQTKAAHQVIDAFLVEAAPEPGSVAAVWRGRLCTHVGVVVEVESRLAVLEVDERIGCRWRWLADWVRLQTRTTFYCDH